MATLLQTPQGDLDLSGHNLALVTDPGEETAIKARNRLKFVLGEWYLDTRLGMPYFQLVFVKNPDLSVISRMFQVALLEIQRVDSVDITQISVTKQRELDFTFKAKLNTGEILTGGSQQQFVLSGV